MIRKTGTIDYHGKHTCSKIRHRLVDNQGVGTAAKLSTCTNQDGEDQSVGKATDAADNQTHCCNRLYANGQSGWRQQRCGQCSG